jgi:MFS transporter, DHA1 family, multidrug resistance protein
MVLNRPVMGRKHLLVLLATVTGIGPLAMHAMAPLLPLISDDFGATMGTVQLMMSLALVGMAVATLFIGPISDALGRRRVLLTALMITSIGSALAATAGTVEQAILGRLVQAMGGVAGIVLARAIATDIYSRADASVFIAQLTAVMVIMPTIAPLIGGELALFTGWRGVFVMVTALTGILWLWAELRLPETLTRPTRTLNFRHLLQGLIFASRSREFWAYTLLATFLMAAFFYFVGSAIFVMSEAFDLGPNIYGRYFLGTSFFYILGNLVAARYMAAWGLRRMIWIGVFFNCFCIGVIVVIAAFGGNAPILMFIPAGFSAIGSGIAAPPVVAAAIAARRERAGAASSLIGFCQFAVAAVAAEVAAFVNHDTIFATVFGFWLLMTAGFVFWRLLIGNQR